MRKRRAECINARPDPSVSALRDLTDESLFSPEARREAGRQLSQVQHGLDPDHWKPFNEVGSGQKKSLLTSKMAGTE